MPKFRISFLILFLIFQMLGYSQVGFSSKINSSLIHEQRIDSLIMLHKKLNAINSNISGFRVQIYFESGNYSKSKAIEVRNSFESRFAGHKAYVSFNEPYYRVRVGDFRSRIEAIGFLKKVLRDYPNAFEVKDLISLDNY